MSLPRNVPTQINRIAGAEGENQQSKPNLKERARDQLKNFALIFIYLWIVFGMFNAHESIVLSQHQMDYRFHGVAVVNALIFAKVMLVADDLRLGHRLNDKPLIYSIFLKSVLFGLTLICFHIVEHVLVGLWDGKSIALSVAEVDADKMLGIASLGTIATVALVPFFILREISRVIGREKFWALFFRRPELDAAGLLGD